MHGFAKVGRREPALLDAIATEAVRRELRDFNPQDLANTVWAYATAGHAPPALFEAVARAAVPRMGEFKPQHLSNTAWAYAVADAPSAALFADARFTGFCAAAEASFEETALAQLHQWQLWLVQERGKTWPQLPATLAERCRVSFSAEEGVPSWLQKQVVKELAALGMQPREEVPTSLGYSLDAVISVEGCDVAVEVDGPTHFVGRLPTGATVLKRRQLRLAGMPLLAVPYWEWDELGDTAARRAYLSQRLRKVAVAPAGGGGGGDRDGEEAAKVSAVPLGWNAFQSSVKGYGLSREEVGRRYRDQRSRGG